MDNQQQSSYHQIFKATSLFGGVQVFNILIGIIRSKFIAILLGPTGMGFSGLLTSTMGMVTGLTNFGLGTSAVKTIAEADAQQDWHKRNLVVSSFRRLVWITGFFGLFITLFLAPWLSELTFGNRNYTYSFIFLSVTLLFTQLSTGQDVLLRGTRKLKLLAKSNVLGALASLLITVPLYFFWGINGVVPAIVITSVITFCISWHFARKVQFDKIKLSFHDVFKEGKSMLTMGILLSISGIISFTVSFLTRIYIGRTGGIEEVGLFNAGFAIVGTYVGLIFTAMSTDYFPRLSRVAHNTQLANETINQQAEIAILILSPILMVFFVFIHWVVQLLYSNLFISVNGMIQWAALGMFFKAVSWAIAFLYLAKGASKLFFLNELLSNFYILLFNVVFYKFFGLDGLGISFMIVYIIYLIQVFYICKKKYSFSFDKSFIYIFLFQLFLGISCFFVVKNVPNPFHYLVGSIIIILSSTFSFRELYKRIGFINIISKTKKKND